MQTQTVVVAQLVRALDCGSRGRRFETGLPPNRTLREIEGFLDLTEFPLKNNTSEEKITKETVKLIGDMFFGSNELKVISIQY